MANFAPLSEEMTEDPYPAYRQLRDEDPVHWSDTYNTWVLSRYEDVRRALGDHETYSSAQGFLLGAGGEVLLPMMQTKDPPEHGPLRRMVNQAFARRNVNPLEEALRRLMTDLIDEVVDDVGAGSAEFDFAEAIAWPFPANVISELMGVPVEDREQFRGWSHDLTTGDITAAANIYGYFEGLVAQRRVKPEDDLVSELIAATDSGDPDDPHIAEAEVGEAEAPVRLTEEELLGQCFQLLVAGHETTTNLLSNTVVLLARRPEWAEAWRNDPSLIPAAVEEVLRFDSPVQGLSRTLTRDVELHGTTMAAGDKVHLLYASANHDERVFENPHTFDPTRNPNHHISFGFGTHFCLGAHLARLEARIGIEEILRRLPKLELVEANPPRPPSTALRGFASLPVRIAA